MELEEYELPYDAMPRLLCKGFENELRKAIKTQKTTTEINTLFSMTKHRVRLKFI